MIGHVKPDVIKFHTLHRCGDTLTAPSGTITSPNYPNNYDDNRECIWKIITGPGTSVQLTVTVVDVEHHSQCTCLYLLCKIVGKFNFNLMPFLHDVIAF